MVFSERFFFLCFFLTLTPEKIQRRTSKYCDDDDEDEEEEMKICQSV